MPLATDNHAGFRVPDSQTKVHPACNLPAYRQRSASGDRHQGWMTNVTPGLTRQVSPARFHQLSSIDDYNRGPRRKVTRPIGSHHGQGEGRNGDRHGGRKIPDRERHQARHARGPGGETRRATYRWRWCGPTYRGAASCPPWNRRPNRRADSPSGFPSARR